MVPWQTRTLPVRIEGKKRQEPHSGVAGGQTRTAGFASPPIRFLFIRVRRRGGGYFGKNVSACLPAPEIPRFLTPNTRSTPLRALYGIPGQKPFRGQGHPQTADRLVSHLQCGCAIQRLREPSESLGNHKPECRRHRSASASLSGSSGRAVEFTLVISARTITRPPGEPSRGSCQDLPPLYVLRNASEGRDQDGSGSRGARAPP